MPDPPCQQSPESSFSVAKRLKSLRQSLALSQREVARRAGITNGTLSLIEQGKVSPSVASLEKVLSGLGMGLADFFSSSDLAHATVIPEHSFEHISTNGADLWVKHLSAPGASNASLVRLEVLANSVTSAAWAPGSRALIGLVVEGELNLQVDGRSYRVLSKEGFQIGPCGSVGFSNQSGDLLRIVVLHID